MRTKNHYDAPVAQILVVISEDAILQVSGDVNPGGWNPGNGDWWNDEDGNQS